MKVVCNINITPYPKDLQDPPGPMKVNLTIGKIYEVMIEPHEYFFAKYIKDDLGHKIQYSESMFTPLEKLRQDKIEQILK